MDKPKRGVKPGSKRSPYSTKKIETALLNFRVPKDKKDYVKPLMRDYLKQLLAEPENIKSVKQISKVSIGSKPSYGIKAGPPPAPSPKKEKEKKSEPTMAELLKQTYKK